MSAVRFDDLVGLVAGVDRRPSVRWQGRDLSRNERSLLTLALLDLVDVAVGAAVQV